MAKKKRAPAPVAKFKIGDKVGVKHGVEDVDYPDMPLGGWAGTVTEIQGTDTFIIRWSKETLDAIHPVFKKRCEKDGLDLEVYGLTGEDLESDAGGPLQIEHPKKITTKPQVNFAPIFIPAPFSRSTARVISDPATRNSQSVNTCSTVMVQRGLKIVYRPSCRISSLLPSSYSRTRLEMSISPPFGKTMSQ